MATPPPRAGTQTARDPQLPCAAPASSPFLPALFPLEIPTWIPPTWNPLSPISASPKLLTPPGPTEAA